MKHPISLKTTISVNVQDSLIMIHKNTLRVLGNPRYVQILVNPEKKSIAVCCSSESDYLAHAVKAEVLTNRKKTMRIHSSSLLRRLHSIYPQWQCDCTYTINGKFISDINIIRFDMSDSHVSSRYDKGECDE